MGGQILREFEDEVGLSITVITNFTDSAIVEVLETADLNIRQAKPSDYYFQLIIPGGFNPTEEEEFPVFYITKRIYFDSTGYLDDQCGAHNTPMPSDFGGELMEAVWDYDGDPQVGRQSLLRAGFVEKKMF